MTTQLASDELSQDLRRRGALILGLFALVWTAAGISGLAIPSSAQIAIAVVAIAVTSTVIALAFRFGGSGADGRARRLPTTWMRDVGWVNGAQFVFIFAGAITLSRTGVPALIPAVICMIVGLHFLPLARSFGQPQYYWTGGLLVAIAAAGFVGFGLGWAAEPVRALVGVGAALVLWCTAFDVAVRG